LADGVFLGWLWLVGFAASPVAFLVAAEEPYGERGDKKLRKKVFGSYRQRQSRR
jgi:hypothetical protein